MEARKIIIVSTRTQLAKTVLTTAENLGDLKADLDEANIDYSGMVFQEGLTKSEFKDDAAILPKNVPYKGTITNELVFRLTTPDKKVSSGSVYRSELYSKIKNMGLQNKCMVNLGKHFTECANEELEELILNNENDNKTEEQEETVNTPQDNTREIVSELIDTLYMNGSLDSEENDAFVEMLRKGVLPKTEKAIGNYTSSEINNLFENA